MREILITFTNVTNRWKHKCHGTLKQTGSTHEHVDNKRTHRKRERKGEWICTLLIKWP